MTKVYGCAHGIGREKCVHCAARCPVCGYRVSVVAGLWGWLNWRQKQYRWPKRKRVSERCPECGTFVILVHQLARDCLETA